MKVLLTDDSMTIRIILKNLLKDLGVTDVTEGCNGQEALDFLTESQFDLILTDIHMPKKDGLTVLEHIKTHPDSKHKDVPVVVISSDSDYRQLDRAKNLGAFGYIKKPFKRENLEAAVNAAKESEARKQQKETLQAVTEISKDVNKVASTPPSAPEMVHAEHASVATEDRSSAQKTVTQNSKKGGLLGWMRKIFGKN